MTELIDRNNTEFNQYLKQLRVESGKKKVQLSRQLHVNPNSIRHYETKRIPDLDYLMAFAEALDISFYELLVQRTRLSHNQPQCIDKALSDLLFFNGDLDEKLNQLGLDKAKAQLLPHFLQQISLEKNNNIVLFEQKGESMAPKIHDKDWLGVDITDTQIKDGMIYMIEMGSQYLARRLQYNVNSQLMVCCDNPQYPSFTLSAENKAELKIIGKMIYFVSR